MSVASSRPALTSLTFRQSSGNFGMDVPPLPRPKQRDPLKQLSFYHGKISRHVTEVLLMTNGLEGSFLIRLANQASDEYCISVKAKDDVKHFKLVRDGPNYMLGDAEFESLDSFIVYIANQPVFGSRKADMANNLENGTMVVLRYPYPYDVQEPEEFDQIRMHSTMTTDSTAANLRLRIKNMPMGTKAGYLIKQGGSIKSWKRRWFVCIRNNLSYYEKREDEKPIYTIDITHATQCGKVKLDGKENESTFALVCKDRKWNFIADYDHEMMDWIELLDWKIQRNNR